MAGYFMSGLYLYKHRTDRLTFLHAVLTAILERAAMRNIQRAWSLTFNTLDWFGKVHINIMEN